MPAHRRPKYFLCDSENVVEAVNYFWNTKHGDFKNMKLMVQW